MGNTRGHAGHHALPRFFVTPEALAGDAVAFSLDQVHKIRRVLRLSAGAKVIVCDGGGEELEVVLAAGDHRVGTVVARLPGKPEPSRQVHLYQSGLRGEPFAWLLQKGTEIGVAAFRPTIYARTQPADYQGRLPRYRSIVCEAAEQCERCRLPAVLPPLTFAQAVALLPAEPVDIALLLDERERKGSLRRTLAEGAPRSLMLFVGPEGGLTAAERDLAAVAGVRSVGLGPRILRSETAGLVAAALVLAECGDLG